MTEFTKQYAIRLPNGLLHAHQPSPWTIKDGVIFYTEPDLETPPEPVVYFDEEEALYALKKFQEKAAHMGITEWLGRIEHRVCGPFTDSSADSVEETMADLEKFLEEQ